MQRARIALGFLGLVVWTACLSGAALGQEDYKVVSSEDSDESEKEATSLRSEVTEVRSQLKQSGDGGYEGGYGCGCGAPVVEAGCGCDVGCGCDACCECDCCNPCCQSQGFYGGAEITFLKPHNSSGTGLIGLEIDDDLEIDATVDPDYYASPRFWAGYQRCDGLGVRARYWKFDDDADGVLTVNDVAVPGSAINHEWDTWVFDLEGTDTTMLGCWQCTLSAGFRYVEYEETRFAFADIVIAQIAVASQKAFDGYGATTSAEFRRQVTCNLGVYLNVRASVVMGDEDNTFALLVAGIADVDVAVTQFQPNDIKYIYESQAGAEYVSAMGGGAQFFARAGAEVQYWDGFGSNPIGLLFDESSGFAGLSAAVGIVH